MADKGGIPSTSDFIANFNPAMYEVQDFYDDIRKIKALCIMVESGDFSQVDLLYGVLKNARRHFWFKLVQSNQVKMLESEEVLRDLIVRFKRMPTNQILEKQLLDKINEHVDLFSRFKSAVGLAVKFESKPLTDMEVLENALGISDVPAYKRFDLTGLGARVQLALNSDWDAVVAITGNEGSGKSHLALQIGKEIDEDFNFVDNVAFVPDEKQIFNMVTKLKKGSVILLDEAVKAFYKLNWNSRMQIMLNELFTLCRSENKATIMCIPSLLDLNKFMRGRRVCMWVHVLKRGKCAVFVRDTNPFQEDPWHFDDVVKKIKKHNINFVRMSMENQLRFLKKLPNYVGVFSFHKLSQKGEDNYNHWKHENRFEDYEKKLNPVEEISREKVALHKLIKNLRDEKTGWDQIHNITGVPKSTLREWNKKYDIESKLTPVKKENVNLTGVKSATTD